MERLYDDIVECREGCDSDRFRLCGASLVKVFEAQPESAHRALKFLFKEGQTRDEQVSDDTFHRNGRGFCKASAKRGSEMARKTRLGRAEAEEAVELAMRFTDQVVKGTSDAELRKIVFGKEEEELEDDEPIKKRSQKRKRAVLESESDSESDPSDTRDVECVADALGVRGASVKALSPMATDMFERALEKLGVDRAAPRVDARKVLKEMGCAARTIGSAVTLFDVHVALCVALRGATPKTGDRVMVLWPLMGRWYSGTVIGEGRKGEVQVLYDDDKQEEWVTDRGQWVYVCEKTN